MDKIDFGDLPLDDRSKTSFIKFEQGVVFNEDNNASSLITEAGPVGRNMARFKKGVGHRGLFALRRRVSFSDNNHVRIFEKHHELLEFFPTFDFEPIRIPRHNFQRSKGGGVLVNVNRGREGSNRSRTREHAFFRIGTTEVLVYASCGIPNDGMHGIRIQRGIALIPESAL